jgi:hypothetical protein
MTSKLPQQTRLLSVKTLFILLLFGCSAIVVFFGVNGLYSLWLAERVVGLPDDATNINAFYIGIGQGRTLYVRFDFPAGNEARIMSDVCEGRYIDENPFQNESSSWSDPNWWQPPQNPEQYIGGTCMYGRQFLIDMTNDTMSTVFFIDGMP